jgi:hypothetical protein
MLLEIAPPNSNRIPDGTAQASQDDSDRVLWLTLAQSWARLAEHVARGWTPEETAAPDAVDSDAGVELSSN